jgi:osmotically-inducible protein OsmY
MILAGCTGLLLGGSNSGGSSVGGDTRSAAQAASDNALATRVRSRLARDPAIGGYALSVQADGGRVTLSGTVNSYGDRDRVVRLAREVDEVRSIDNRIRVDTR